MSTQRRQRTWLSLAVPFWLALIALAAIVILAGCRSSATAEAQQVQVAQHEGHGGEPAPASQPSGAHEMHGADEPMDHGQHGAPAAHAGHEGHEAMEAAEPLPGMSVYQLEGAWTRQDGEEIELSSLRGHPVVALMFFGTCEHACPILISDLKRLEAGLSDEARAETRFMLVTIDPENDTPAALTALGERHEVDFDRWHFLRGDEGQIRELAAVLGVQYRPSPELGFTHTNLITVLDRDGVVREQVEGLRQPVAPLISAVEEELTETEQ